MGVRWTHNFGNLAGLTQTIQSDLPGRVTRQWGARWMGMIRKRFDTFSKGGGDWQPLAPATIARRRFGGGGGGTIGSARKRAIARLQATREGSKSEAASIRRLRRVAAAAGSVAILRDTGTLFRATSIGAPGNLFENIHKGVRAGFAGARVHKSGKATLAQIAAYHNRGGGRLPRRQILVAPDAATRDAMKGDLQRETIAAMRAAGIRPGQPRKGAR